MSRDKAKDDELFNCSEQHEENYVASLYPDDAKKVREIIQQACANGIFKNSTHKEVYEYIDKKLS